MAHHEKLTIPEPRTHRDGDGRWVPPPLTAEPRLYALLAVEVRPGTIVYYHLELDHEPGACTIDVEREDLSVHADLLRPAFFGPWHVEATISGTCVSQERDYRPPARTTAEQAAIGSPARALPAGGDHPGVRP